MAPIVVSCCPRPNYGYHIVRWRRLYVSSFASLLPSLHRSLYIRGPANQLAPIHYKFGKQAGLQPVSIRERGVLAEQGPKWPVAAVSHFAVLGRFFYFGVLADAVVGLSNSEGIDNSQQGFGRSVRLHPPRRARPDATENQYIPSPSPTSPTIRSSPVCT